MDGTMARKRHKPEEIVAKLRQADVLTGQGKSIAVVDQAPAVGGAAVVDRLLLRRLAGAYPNTRAFFEGGGPQDARTAENSGEQVVAQRVLSPVTQEARFVCQATNYADHIREVGGDPAQVVNNVIFTKASSSIAPPDADIVRPGHVKLLDYEIELGLVPGRGFDRPRTVTPDNLAD